MDTRAKLFFQLQKLIILGFVLIYDITFLDFLLILIIEYTMQVLMNVVKMRGTGTGNIVAFEQDKDNYRFNIKFDYLYYNMYIILIMLVPVAYSIFILGLGVNSFNNLLWLTPWQNPQLVALISMLLLIQIIQTIIYFISRQQKSSVIEELAHFDFVRLFIFCLFMLFSGPVAWSLELSDNIFQFPLILMMIFGDSLLNLFFNKEKETVIF